MGPFALAKSEHVFPGFSQAAGREAALTHRGPRPAWGSPALPSASWLPPDNPRPCHMTRIREVLTEFCLRWLVLTATSAEAKPERLQSSGLTRSSQKEMFF